MCGQMGEGKLECSWLSQLKLARLGCVTKVTLFGGGHQLHGANDTPWCRGAWTGYAWVAPEGSRPCQPFHPGQWHAAVTHFACIRLCNFYKGVLQRSNLANCLAYLLAHDFHLRMWHKPRKLHKDSS